MTGAALGAVTHAAAWSSSDGMKLSQRVRRLAFEVMALSSLARGGGQVPSAAGTMKRSMSPLDVPRAFALDGPTARLIWASPKLNEPSLELDSTSPTLA